LAGSGTLLPVVTIAIPLLAKALINAKSLKERIHIIKVIVEQFLTIVPVVIATLALTYIYPSRIVSCSLEQQWQSYFHTKDSRAIRTIQDGLQCCGLRSIHDRAWPFKDSTHGDNACELQFGYRRSCLDPWKETEQSIAWMVFTAAVLAFIVKVFLFLSFQRVLSMDRSLIQVAYLSSYSGQFGATSYFAERVNGRNRNVGVVANEPNPRLIPYSDDETGQNDDHEADNDGGGTRHGTNSRWALIGEADDDTERGLRVVPSGLGRHEEA
jgi:hypothetical protein